VERVVRWCRRNPNLAAALAGIAASLLIGTAVSVGFAIQSSRNATQQKLAREDADRNAEKAKDSAESAKISAAEGRRLLGEFSVANGARDMREGNFYRGMLWYAEPLVRDGENPGTAEMARTRLSLSWRYAERPRETSHTRAVLSSLAVTTRWPSGLNDACTTLSWRFIPRATGSYRG
jgi:hypothetical protein